jgi:putative colanic acid biosynthesis UDP-glucose lipid carrier transferase
MMDYVSNSRRSVLQRRNSVSNLLQAAIDGIVVIGIAYLLIDWHIGVLTAEYLNFLLILVGTLALVYDHYAIYRANSTFTRKALTLFKAWCVGFAILLTIGFLSKQSEVFSRVLVAQLFVLGYFAQLATLFVFRKAQIHLIKHGVECDKAIIVGSGKLANHLYQKISGNPWLGVQIEGCVLLDQPSDLLVDRKKHGLKILGGIADLITLVELHDIQIVYFVTPLDGSKVLENAYFKLLDRHVAIHWIPDIFSLRLINHSVREIAGIPVLTLSETPLTGTSTLVKAIEDLALSAVILVLVSPLMLIIPLLIKLDSPGPVFFRQERMGWNGKHFLIWKFRTMYVHQPENGVIKQAEKGDSRVTRIGAILRRTSLDELPQIFNVIQGQMSLVGPRPHAVQHDIEYAKRIEDYFSRHNIKPGITGLAQVRGYRGETREIGQMMHRVESDIEYINNWSLWLDLSILARTFVALAGKNAY